MINFEDLKPEDQERLLEQAKLIIDEENIRKNAIATYKIKRKELVDGCLKEIMTHYKVKNGPEEYAIRQRFVSLTNYFYKVNLAGKYHTSSSAAPLIKEAKEWDKFVKINNAVKELFINCKEV